MNQKNWWKMVLVLVSMVVPFLSAQSAEVLRVEVAPLALKGKVQAVGFQVEANGQGALLLADEAAASVVKTLGFTLDLTGKMLVLTGTAVDSTVQGSLDLVDVAATEAVLTGAAAVAVANTVVKKSVEAAAVTVILPVVVFRKLARTTVKGVTFLAKGTVSVLQAGRKAIGEGGLKVMEAAIACDGAAELASNNSFQQAAQESQRAQQHAQDGRAQISTGANQLRANGVLVSDEILKASDQIIANSVKVASPVDFVAKKALVKVQVAAEAVKSETSKIVVASTDAIALAEEFVVDGLLKTGAAAVVVASKFKEGSYYLVTKTSDGVLKTSKVFTSGFRSMVAGLKGVQKKWGTSKQSSQDD